MALQTHSTARVDSRLPSATPVENPQRRELLFGLSAAPMLTHQEHCDAALLKLGAALQASWDAEIAPGLSEAERNAAEDRSSRLVYLIENIPATTLEGLRIKALAVSWTRCGDPVGPDAFGDLETTDVRLAASIVSDLLAIGGA